MTITITKQYMNENEKDVRDEDLEPTEEDNLLVTTFPGPRIFTLNNALDTTLLGVLMDESDDSFLVALPSRMVKEDGTNEPYIKPYVQAPYFRLMKNAVSAVMFMFEPFKSVYMDYLASEGAVRYPQVEEFLGEPDPTAMQMLDVEIIEETDEDIREAAGEAARKLSVNTDSGVEHKALGMTDEELEEYLINKYKNGDLYGGPGSKQ